MAVNEPNMVHVVWTERFNAGDVEGMKALAEDGAIFVPQPGTPVTGADADAAQQGFLAMGLPINMTVRHTFVKDDVALVIADWTMKGRAADGNDIDLSGTAADVVRRGPDGWKFAIDNPFGTA
jgi:ketosteroid isomerase-like protein